MGRHQRYLMVFTEDRYCQLVSGSDPAQAVIDHYDEMNAMCPVSDPELSDEFVVTLYEVTGDHDEVYEPLARKLDESDYIGCDALHAQLQPSRIAHRVGVVMRANDVQTSLLP